MSLQAAERLTNPQIEELIGRLRFDHAGFCKQTLEIRNKSGKQVPLVLTPGQVKLTTAIEHQERLGLPIRVRCLKAGQVHMSMGACSHVLRRTAFTPGTHAKVYAHLFEATRNLYDYFTQFLANYKPFFGLAMPKVARTNQDHIIEFANHSSIEFGSAETSRGGRSRPFKVLELSETAFWRRAEDLRTGLLARVPDDPDTLIIDESTANGASGSFYRGWMEAMDPSSTSGWIGVFVAWWELPEYSRELADPAVFQRSLYKEEWEIRNRYNLTLGQMAWRRWAIQTTCEGDINRFHQEFPACPEEAFVASGRTVFDMKALERQPLVSEALVGDLCEENTGIRVEVQFNPRQDGHGPVSLWKRPEKRHFYLVSTDAAKGIDVSDRATSADPDYAVAHVFDTATCEQVAMIRDRIEPSKFGEMVVATAKWYNWAYIAPDADGPAVAMIEAILRSQYPLELIYNRQRDPDDRRPLLLQDIGFLTTTVTKPQAIASLSRALREMTVLIRDKTTRAELRTFVTWPNGKQAASQGNHDDCVMALAVGVHTLPFAVRAQERREAAAKAEANKPVAEVVQYRRIRR